MSSELRRLWEQAGGKVPDDWKIVPFESLFRDNKSIAVGVMYPGPNTVGGAPLLKVGDIKDGLVPEKPSYCISAATNEEHKRTQLVGDELLITLVGNPGECVVATRAMVGWNPARAIAVVRLRDPSLRTYLKTVLESTPSKHLIDAVLNTTVQKTLNLKDVRQLPIPLPSGCVIEKISGIADSLIHRIALLRETNATLEAIAQAMFKSWFVDFDPVHAKQQGRAPEGMSEATAALFPDSFEESELGLVPRGWKWTRLDAIATVIMGLSPKGDSYNYEGIGVPLINGPVEFGDYFPVQTKWTDSASRLAKEGDLIFCVRGSTTGRRVVSDREYCIGRGVCAIRANKDLSGFIYQTINFGLDRLLGKTTGSVFPSLSAPDIKNFNVLNPAEEVIFAYENTTKPILHRIQENHRQAQTLATLRDTLLPRLISGQLRLPQAEAALEEAAA